MKITNHDYLLHVDGEIAAVLITHKWLKDETVRKNTLLSNTRTAIAEHLDVSSADIGQLTIDEPDTETAAVRKGGANVLEDGNDEPRGIEITLTPISIY